LSLLLWAIKTGYLELFVSCKKHFLGFYYFIRYWNPTRWILFRSLQRSQPDRPRDSAPYNAYLPICIRIVLSRSPSHQEEYEYMCSPAACSAKCEAGQERGDRDGRACPGRFGSASHSHSRWFPRFRLSLQSQSQSLYSFPFPAIQSKCRRTSKPLGSC